MFLQILNEYVCISNKIAALEFCIVLWIMMHTGESCFFYVNHLVMKHRYDELKLQILSVVSIQIFSWSLLLQHVLHTKRQIVIKHTEGLSFSQIALRKPEFSSAVNSVDSQWRGSC